MHVIEEQIDACNAIMIFGVHGWSFSLIKSWVKNLSVYNGVGGLRGAYDFVGLGRMVVGMGHGKEMAWMMEADGLR